MFSLCCKTGQYTALIFQDGRSTFKVNRASLRTRIHTWQHQFHLWWIEGGWRQYPHSALPVWFIVILGRVRNIANTSWCRFCSWWTEGGWEPIPTHDTTRWVVDICSSTCEIASNNFKLILSYNNCHSYLLLYIEWIRWYNGTFLDPFAMLTRAYYVCALHPHTWKNLETTGHISRKLFFRKRESFMKISQAISVFI
jgi:hypothetical protein